MAEANLVFVVIKMKVKPDDYFNNGQFEMARYGEKVSLKNIMTPKDNQEYIHNLKTLYPQIIKNINELITSLRQKIVKCNPIELLSFSSDNSLMSMISLYSEINVKDYDISTAHMTEYVQSVLIATPNQFETNNDRLISDPSEIYYDIQNDIEKLYKLIETFYRCMGATLEDRYPAFDQSILIQIFEAQLLFLVRGQRYQVFEAKYLKNLLKAHNEIFLKIYNLNAEQVIDGILALQYALSQGKIDSVKTFAKLMESFNNSQNNKEFFQKHQALGQNFLDEFLGTRLRNVLEVTHWNEKITRELSFELGEDVNFFSTPDFAGWPIIDLPVHKRPFIKIENEYYCFDYYSFMDNIYRSIQKATTRLAPKYDWFSAQAIASEEMVENIFQDLLPGCQTYIGNYYPINNSLKEMAENDLLVIYSNTLIIVEVKAGSFVYTAPITDFESHIRSYQALIEKADWQCKRTYDYIISNEKPNLYNKNKQVKTQIDMNKIEYVYMMSITVDNINDFAAKAEKLNFLNLKCNAISISVDDLMVYQEYFNSPLLFLHFLKHRQLATQKEKLALNDELDHLGMYIKHNYYSFKVDSLPKDATQLFYGYRKELDDYFTRLYHPQLDVKKPLSNIPNLFLEIICFLELHSVYGREQISNYLLDFSSDAKNEFCYQIDCVIKRQLKTKGMGALHAAGSKNSLRYTCFVNQPQVKSLLRSEKIDYVLASLVRNKEKDRVLIDLYFDEQNKLSDIKFNHYLTQDINEDDKKRLLNYGEQIAQHRFNEYLATNLSKSDKIGRNQICPCGSGKKYKKCCGR